MSEASLLETVRAWALKQGYHEGVLGYFYRPLVGPDGATLQRSTGKSIEVHVPADGDGDRFLFETLDDMQPYICCDFAVYCDEDGDPKGYSFRALQWLPVE